MKRYKLKESIKEKLIFIALGLTAVILLAIISAYSNNAYEECLIENNNDTNFCFELIK